MEEKRLIHSESTPKQIGWILPVDQRISLKIITRDLELEKNYTSRSSHIIALLFFDNNYREHLQFIIRVRVVENQVDYTIARHIDQKKYEI